MNRFSFIVYGNKDTQIWFVTYKQNKWFTDMFLQLCWHAKSLDSVCWQMYPQIFHFHWFHSGLSDLNTSFWGNHDQSQHTWYVFVQFILFIFETKIILKKDCEYRSPKVPIYLAIFSIFPIYVFNAVKVLMIDLIYLLILILFFCFAFVYPSF